MKNPIKLFTKNLPLKIVSLLLGYTFWATWNNTRLIQKTFTVPICFYNSAPSDVIDAPESMNICIEAKYRDMSHLDSNNLAIHLNTAHLHEGPNLCVPTCDNLLLPESFHVVHYEPSNNIITYEKKS